MRQFLVAVAFAMVSTASSFAQTTSFREALPSLLDSDQNEYVLAIQQALKNRGVDISLSGQLTRSTITDIAAFCSTSDILSTCRHGILTEEAAVAIGLALDGGGASETEAVAEVKSPAGAKVVEITLQCGRAGNFPPFQRTIEGKIDDGAFVVAVNDKPDGDYDRWSGTVSKTEPFTVTGSYVEGGGATKSLRFTAHWDGSKMEGAGNRGPRDCSFVAQ